MKNPYGRLYGNSSKPSGTRLTRRVPWCAPTRAHHGRGAAGCLENSGSPRRAVCEGAVRIHEVTVYKHAGIELARMPGAEKLRVRVTKETGDAQVGGEAGESVLGEMD